MFIYTFGSRWAARSPFSRHRRHKTHTCGSVTPWGIALFPGVLRYAGKRTRRAAAWETAPLKRDRAAAAAREKQFNEQEAGLASDNNQTPFHACNCSFFI